MAPEDRCEKRIKNLKLAGLAVLMIVFALLAAFYAQSLPKEAESTVVSGIKPELSADSGFYNAPFELSIESADPDFTVYYTLDGSIPDENSFVYSEPLYIYDATENPNVLAARDDLSTGYMSVKAFGDYYYSPEYKLPDFKVDKCTVIRAVGISADGRRTEEASASYFVGFDSKDGYANGGVISLVTDPSNLLDEKTGIFVLGRDYKIFNAISKIMGKGREWTWWGANYRKQGEAWEREAEISWFDPDKVYQGSQDCGIRVHGNISRARLPRGLSLYAREEYSGTDKFDLGLFDSGYTPQKFVLYGQESFRKDKEYVITEAVKDIGTFATLDFSPCVLFINGEYFGNYLIGEKYDGKYIADTYDVDAQSVQLVKDNHVVEGSKETLLAYKRMYNYISMHDMTKPENYEKALSMFDVDSYIDYNAVEYYICNTDWPKKNYAAWKADSGSSEYADGKWRWMLFDLNIGRLARKDYAEYDMFVHAMRRDHMMTSLMANEEFRTKMLNRIVELAENEFNPYVIGQSFIDHFNRTQTAIAKEHQRFYGFYSNADFEYREQLDSAIDFFFKREIYMKNACQNWDYKKLLKQVQWPVYWQLEEGILAGVLLVMLAAIGIMIHIDRRRNGKHGKN